MFQTKQKALSWIREIFALDDVAVQGAPGKKILEDPIEAPTPTYPHEGRATGCPTSTL